VHGATYGQYVERAARHVAKHGSALRRQYPLAMPASHQSQIDDGAYAHTAESPASRHSFRHAFADSPQYPRAPHHVHVSNVEQPGCDASDEQDGGHETPFPRQAPRAHHAHTALAGPHAPLDAADAQDARHVPLSEQYPPMPGHHWHDGSASQSAEFAPGQDEMQLTLVDAQYPAPHHWHEG
jgi:hypothetical protein